MEQTFGGVLAKIQRAEEIAAEALAEIATLIDRHYHVTKKQYVASRVTVFVETTAAPEDFTKISILVGEAIYQLRSALDHAFWLLIAGDPRGYDRHRNFLFPVCKTLNSFKSMRGQKMWKLVEGAEDVIERLQPYHEGKEFWRNPLWILNELSVMDRHRLLTTTMLGAGLPWTDTNWTYVVPFDPHTPIAFQHAPTADVTAKAVVMVSVDFENGPFEQEITPLLRLLIDRTRDIISALAPLLPHS